MITIYTDGANTNNGKVWSHGGYGWIISWDNHELEGGDSCPIDLENPVTNNRMELLAIITSLNTLAQIGVENQHIKVYSDSQWCINCAIGEWSRKKNKDLWSYYNKVAFNLKKGRNIIEFIWVKGHDGNEMNERADQLAVYFKNKVKPSQDEIDKIKAQYP